MSDYYIDPTGANGTGSQASPYNSFASVPSLVAGDNVYFKRGTTHVGQVLYNAARGASTTLASPITFGAYGAGAKPRVTSVNWCIDIDAREGIVVRDIQCGATGTYSDGGVRVLNAGNCTVYGVTIEDRCNQGIRFDNTTAGLLRNINAMYNEVLGTFNDVGIVVIWGTSVGGIYEDVTVTGNTVTRTGARATDTSNTPQGIRFLSRTTPVTTSSGTVELNLFSRGVVCEYNRVTETPGMGISVGAVSAGGTETQRNRVCSNTLRNNGDGRFDAHVIWLGCVRDALVAFNDIDGSVMFQGAAFGTGIGIFVDNYGFDNLYDNSKRVVVRSNRIKNCGRKAEGSTNSLEVAGCGILVFLSQSIDVISNEVDGCYNGIGVMGWFGGSSGKAATVAVRGNRSLNATRDAYVVCKAADAVTLQENYGAGHGGAGIYTENAGTTMVITNYTETRNNIVGPAARAYMGGSEPTSLSTPRAQRTPSADNLVLSRAVV